SGSNRAGTGWRSICGISRERMHSSWPCKARHPRRSTAMACQYQLEFHETNNTRDGNFRQ
ncbi:hypothetical protein KI387_029973, partial [Taxus chinensis]